MKGVNMNDSELLENAVAGTVLLSSEERTETANEKEILSTLLFDGIQSYLNFRGAQSAISRQRFIAAYRWVHDESSDDAFAFQRVCGSLGLEPDAVRLGLANICTSYLSKGKAD